MTVGLIGRIVVNAPVVCLGDGATLHTTFHKFFSNESGTGTAEVVIDSFTARGTVGSTDDLHLQAIFLGDACHFVEVDELGGVEEGGSAETEEEIDGGSEGVAAIVGHVGGGR